VQYLLLIYENEADNASLDPARGQEIYERYMRYTEELKASGAYRAGDALHPTSTASTVRVRNGKATTTDGPFAETKEQLGGYYLIDVPDLDAALKWAAKIPTAESGSVEVRPIVQFG
jgi:hypothetical protein